MRSNMVSAFDGDLIRPLGLVTLHFGYAEYELDRLLEDLSVIEAFDDKRRQWPVGKRLSLALRLLTRLPQDRVGALKEVLERARVLFERRNFLVHSSLFSSGRVVSSRADVPEGRTSPEELVSLAEAIAECKEHINVHRCRTIRPLLCLGSPDLAPA